MQNYGVLITNGDSCLASKDPEVTHGGTSNVEWVQLPAGNMEELAQDLSCLWHIRPLDVDQYFHIELTYGEKKPRLFQKMKEDGNFKLVVTTKFSDDTDLSGIWHIS